MPNSNVSDRNSAPLTLKIDSISRAAETCIDPCHFSNVSNRLVDIDYYLSVTGLIFVSDNWSPLY